MTLTDEEIDNIWRATEGHWNFARGIEARVLEELRKQEPVGWVNPRLVNGVEWNSKFNLKNGASLYAAPIPPTVTPSNKDWYAVAVGVEKTEGIISLGAEKEVARLTEALAETHDAWSGTMEVCRVRGTHGRADYITTGNRMDNRCNLRVTFNGSELIKAEIARPPNTPDGLCMFAVIGMPTPPEGSGK